MTAPGTPPGSGFENPSADRGMDVHELLCPRGHAIDWLTPELGVCDCDDTSPGLVCVTWTRTGHTVSRSEDPVLRLLAARLLHVRYFLEDDADIELALRFLTTPLEPNARISPAALAAARETGRWGP